MSNTNFVCNIATIFSSIMIRNAMFEDLEYSPSKYFKNIPQDSNLFTYDDIEFLFSSTNISDKRIPIMVARHYPTALGNRVYKDSGINFKFPWFLPEEIDRNVTTQCDVFNLLKAESFYPDDCYKCFQENEIQKPKQSSMEDCILCLHKTRSTPCNKIYITVPLTNKTSTQVTFTEFFLQTSVFSNIPAIKSQIQIHKIFKSQSGKCPGHITILPPVINQNNKPKPLNTSEIQNLGIICQVTNTLSGVQYKSEPLIFKSSDLKQPQQLALVISSHFDVTKAQLLSPIQNALQHTEIPEKTSVVNGFTDNYKFKFLEYIQVLFHYGSSKVVGFAYEHNYVFIKMDIYKTMSLLGATPQGVQRIPGKFPSIYSVFATQLDSLQREIKYRVGCFNWVQNKWFAIVTASNTSHSHFMEDERESEQFLASFIHSSGDHSWGNVKWTKLDHIEPKENIVSLKCDQLGNSLVWSSIDEENRISVLKVMVDDDNGRLASKPQVLKPHKLCSCTNGDTVSSPAIDVVHQDINDPYSLGLGVLCGISTICLQDLDFMNIIKKIDLYNFLSEDEEITWFQLDQSYVYFTKNSTVNVYVAPINPTEKTNATDMFNAKNFFKKNILDIDVHMQIKVLWFELYKDQWKIPAPPYHCMFIKLFRKNINVSMLTNTTIKLMINIKWTRPTDCDIFARPRLKFVIKYAPTPNNLDEQQPKNLKFMQIGKVTNSSVVIFEIFRIKNVTQDSWYHIEVVCELLDFSKKMLYLWYSGKPKTTKSSFNYFTHYPQQPKTKISLIIIVTIVGIFVLLLLIVGMTGYFAWKGNRTWEIPEKLLRLHKHEIVLSENDEDIIGHGHFGNVCKAIWRKIDGTEEVVVVKTLKLEASTEDKLAFREEAIMVSKLECKYIVETRGICLQSRPTMLVFEYINGGSLNNYLNNEKYQMLINSDDLFFLMSCALEACVYLESHGFVHRDIAARNCLVSFVTQENPKPKQLKLADFGLAKDIGSETVYESPIIQTLPLNSSAPESLQTPSRSDNKSDVWSFGVLVYEIYSWSSVPFGPCKLSEAQHAQPCKMQPISAQEAADKVVNYAYNLLLHPLPCVGNFNQSLKEIVEFCFKSKSADRPTFSLLKDLIRQRRESITAIELTPPSQVMFVKPLNSHHLEQNFAPLLVVSEAHLAYGESYIPLVLQNKVKSMKAEHGEENKFCSKNSKNETDVFVANETVEC